MKKFYIVTVIAALSLSITHLNAGEDKALGNGLRAQVVYSAKDDGTLNSGGSGGGPATVADGADVAEGATTDAAATQGAAGTISAKLRTVTSQLNTISTNTGNIQSSTVTDVKSTALEGSHVLKASGGKLVRVDIFSSRTTSQFILIMDSATVPSDGAVTLLCPPIPIGPNGYVSLQWNKPPTATNGIAISNSSTGSFTKTIGSADCVFTAQVQ
jgi:hypothetical protein